MKAVHLRHALVGHDHRDVVGAGQRQRLLAAPGEEQLEHPSEVEPEGVEVVGLVVDDEHRILAQLERLSHDATVTHGRGAWALGAAVPS